MLVTLMFLSPLSHRDGDLVQSLHTQTPVKLVLAPIGFDAVDGPAGHMQEPDLVQVHELLLIDNAKEVRGLCSLNGDFGDGGAIVAGEEPAHAQRKIRKRAGQLLEILASHHFCVSLEVQRHHGDACVWSNQGQGTARVTSVHSGKEAACNINAAHLTSTPNFFRMASAVASEESGFWPVIRLRSTTTWDTQLASPSSKTAP